MKQYRIFLLFFMCAGLAACSSTKRNDTGKPEDSTPAYKVGAPYKIAGKTYRPEIDPHYDQTGLASWYGTKFHGRKTANGDVFNMNDLTAAHPTLPMPSYVRVTNLANSRWLILKVNDRGPFVGDRLIDVSRRAAQLLGFEGQGVTQVRVQAATNARGDLPRQILAQNQNQNQPSDVAAAEADQDGGTSPARTGARDRTVVATPLPTVAPAPAAVQQALSGKAKKLYVQIGAYADPRNAQKVVEDLLDIHETSIDKVDIHGQNLYRVRVGPHPSLELAEIMLGRLLSLGHNTARIIKDY